MGLNTGMWGTIRLRDSGLLVVKIEDEDCDTTSRFTFIQNSIQFEEVILRVAVGFIKFLK